MLSAPVKAPTLDMDDTELPALPTREETWISVFDAAREFIQQLQARRLERERSAPALENGNPEVGRAIPDQSEVPLSASRDRDRRGCSSYAQRPDERCIALRSAQGRRGRS